ncbi:TolC family protein [Oxynema sp. CENA135]|uniref:TolC family protein n=1 Tax=Oxynema sp. CENA135 TaxID=984206 RepID=UPI0019098C9B|nr:TolC family protein [Oxynema sp. CENA135]MBK4729049.1 TolC family protein [Oxynema sp. CENA135]
MRTFRLLMVLGMTSVVSLSQMRPSLSQPPSQLQPEDGELSDSGVPSATVESDSREDALTPSADSQIQGSGNGTENAIASPGRIDPFTDAASTVIGQFAPGGATGSREGAPPEYLDPSTNPLLYPTEAQEVEIVGTQPLTLTQAIELARRNNPDLQEALLNFERSQAALREARAALYPNLQLRSNLTHADSSQTELSNERQRDLFGDNATEQDDSTTSLEGTVELSYNLYTSGQRPAQIRAAEERVRLNELELERIAAQLRFDVTDAYYNLQEADDAVRINRSAVDSSQQSLRDAEARERAGVGTRFDVLRARVQLANSEQDLTQSLSQQRIRRRELAQILNIPQSVDVSAADEVEIAGLWELSLEESIIRAFQNRAELEQQLVQREINEQQRRAALAALGPQVSLFANYNVIDIFDDDQGLADGYALGARLQWNLYDGGAAKARAAQEEKNIEIAENRFTSQRNQIRTQVEQAYYNLQSNFRNIQTANIALDQARESLRLARLRFQAGVGTQTEVLDAETELTRAENNRLQAIVRYNRALASMRRSITNLDDPYRSDRPSAEP